MVLEDEYLFIAQCDFMAGSSALGCMVVLVGKHDNVTLRLTRLHGQSALGAIPVVNQPSDDYHGIVAFDIESDGSVGALAIRGHVNTSTTDIPRSTKCASKL